MRSLYQINLMSAEPALGALVEKYGWRAGNRLLQVKRTVRILRMGITRLERILASGAPGDQVSLGHRPHYALGAIRMMRAAVDRLEEAEDEH